MMTAIRKSLRDLHRGHRPGHFRGVISYYIFQKQRLRIPVLEEKPFQFQAEFDNAQGVVAGQGQTLSVAGVRVGDVSDVELVDGRAVVTFDVDREYLPIYEDATILMRPLTGLRDMFFSLDPGTRSASGGEIEEGDTVPLANTAPDVPLDQVLEALDNDNQAYLRAILVGAGQGLEDRGKDLGAHPRQPRPDQPRPREAQHRGRRARREPQPPGPQPLDPHQVDRDAGPGHRAPRDRVERHARGDRAGGPGRPERDRASCPARSTETRDALAAAKEFGDELGPTFNSLRPFARNLPELNSSTHRARRDGHSRDPRRDPAVRALGARADPGSEPGGRASSRRPRRASTTIAKKLNHLGNMAAYNPRGKEPVGTRGPRRGLPLLGRLAGPQRRQRLSGPGRQRASTAASTSRPAACNIQNIVTGGLAADPAELAQVFAQHRRPASPSTSRSACS